MEAKDLMLLRQTGTLITKGTGAVYTAARIDDKNILASSISLTKRALSRYLKLMSILENELKGGEVK